MRGTLPMLFALWAIFLSGATFAQDRIVRQGFTLSLSMGPGAAYLSPKGAGTSATQGGLGGINIFLGGFVNPDLGLYVDVAPIFSSNFFTLTYQGGFAWQYY